MSVQAHKEEQAQAVRKLREGAERSFRIWRRYGRPISIALIAIAAAIFIAGMHKLGQF